VTRNAEFKTLGLSSDANWDDVKRAFRKLALVYHPDVAGPESARKFAEITEAYMALRELNSGGAAAARPRPVKRKTRRGEAAPRESVFKKIWRMIFSRDRESAKDFRREDNIPPARVRFISGVISRAESEISLIMSKRAEFAERARAEALSRRIKSGRPAVVSLALRKISAYDANEELLRDIAAHFKKNAPPPEILEKLLDIFSNSDSREELAAALIRHINKFSDSDAVLIINRLKRWRAPRAFYHPFFSHKSPAVVACALNCLPLGRPGPEKNELVGLLKKDDEAILVPLLRILKREKLPLWTGARLVKLTKEHPSAAVRVWASAIVRDQNLS
jgi:curved DNA-binding protein CbpA